MNIYVSNINFRTEDASLNQLFANYGEVNSTRIITDRETGRSRGFGFVEMLNDEEGQAAIDALNGKEFEEKELNPSLTGIIIFHKFSVCFEGFRFAKYLIISRSVF